MQPRLSAPKRFRVLLLNAIGLPHGYATTVGKVLSGRSALFDVDPKT